MANRKINELSPRTPSLTDLIIVGDPSTGYSYRATISVLAAFAGSNIQFSSLNGVSITSPTTGQYLTYNGTNWVNATLSTTDWDTAYNRSLTGAAVTGTSTKTLTLTKQDGTTLTASWSDLNTDAVTSVFGRTGAVVSAEGDYTLDQLGGVTITTPSTNQVLQYNGTAWVNATFVAGVSGSGTTNYLSKWTSSSALGNSLVFDNGTSVGVNTASPSATYKLDVSGATRILDGTSSIIVDNAQTYKIDINGYFKIRDGATNYILISAGNLNAPNGLIVSGSLQFGANTINNYTGSYIGFNLGSSGGTERMRLTTNGRLLIGTTTESTYELDVVGDIRSTLDANINGLTVGKGGGSVATNTAVGNSALSGNATGGSNVAIGMESLNPLTSGERNVSVGRQSGLSMTTGSRNTLVGYFASRNKNGSDNTFIGHFSGATGATGDGNTAVGNFAGTQVTGNLNNFFGHYSGYDITTGTYNTFAGSGSAGNGITTGSYNTIIGSQITGLATTLSNTIILADGQGNQRLYINSSGNVGIGTTSPTAGYILDANGSVLIRGGANQIGSTSAVNVVDMIGSAALGTATRYRDNITLRGAVGTETWVQGSSLTGFSIYAYSGNPLYFYTGGAKRMMVTDAGRLLVGTATESTYLLDINGTARVSGGAAGALFVGNSGTNWGLRLDNSTYPYIRFNRAGTVGRSFGIFNASGDIAIQEGEAWSGANYHIFYGTGGYSTNGSGNFGNNVAANASAVLEATSTTKGFLPPRMTGAQAEAIATPASGLMVYANNGNGTTITSLGWWGYNGTTWVKLN